MCGIAGLLTPPSATAEELSSWAQRMADAIRHRGPDDEGVWVDAAAGIAFGHRRLSIVDLSPEGHQPMASANGRFVLSYNGEIYGFDRLRDELAAEGHSFRGHSDTEVLVEAIARWGLTAAVGRCAGMFAFSLWDREQRTLSLVRDRLGIKPLYYGWVDGTLLFASELKAMRAYPRFRAAVDRDALTACMRYGYVPAPATIYERIHKLPPGTILTVHAGRSPAAAEPVPFWSAREVAERGTRDAFPGSDIDAIDELERALREVVRQHMVADVPLGAFLSGGIDSSTVVALMQSVSPRPVKTFSIGFREPEFDEAPHARPVAAHLGTEHHELYVSAADALEVIPNLATWWDEPLCDPSQIPTFLVSKLTRGFVTVSLSGDGGDELFAGYPRYALALDQWRRIGAIPTPARALAGSAAGSIKARAGGARSSTSLLPALGDSVLRRMELLSTESLDALYRNRFMSPWDDPESIVIGGKERAGPFADRSLARSIPSPLDRMQFYDLVTYLPDDILTKVDRASMAVSLEARVPVLDHRIVELAWRFPERMRVRNGVAKWVLRQVLDRHVPRRLIDRPKMGFGVPIDRWLRGPLREWGEALLDEGRLRREGFLDPARIRRRWTEHLSGRRRWHYSLWHVLMFEAWLERWA
jgi:asparagine synthase (glutamine-hydrolysing)